MLYMRCELNIFNEGKRDQLTKFWRFFSKIGPFQVGQSYGTNSKKQPKNGVTLRVNISTKSKDRENLYTYL